MKYFVAFLLSLFLVVPSFAQETIVPYKLVPKEVDLSKFLTPYKFVITEDHGGEMSKYTFEYTLVRQLNGKVVIDGVCISACGLVLALVPRENICSTQFGKFGFHSAKLVAMGSQGVFSQEATKYYYDLMPKDVIAKIKEKEPDWDIYGDKAHDQVLFIDAQELVQACPSFDK